jgi:RNA polymerase sigma-70 factor (ECF subfamily)
VGELTDTVLVGRCRAGDQLAWRKLVQRHAPLVHGLLRGSFRLSPPDAEDAFQEVFTRVYVRLESVRDADALRGWIAQITRNVALDTLRRGGRETPDADRLQEEEAADQLERLESALVVRAGLDRLAPAQREILDRFFTRDESYRTIAEALEIAPGTIASRISRALAALREQLETPGRSAASGPSSWVDARSPDP